MSQTAAQPLKMQTANAVAQFWVGRSRLPHELAAAGGKGQPFNAGNLLDGFFSIFENAVSELGVHGLKIVPNTNSFIPGYFRPNKRWGQLYFLDDNLAAALEVRALVGRAAIENYAARLEEALAMGFDFTVAADAGLFQHPFTPWSGFLLIVESNERTNREKLATEPHVDGLPELKETSIIDRCAHFCKKIVEQEIFNSAALIVIDPTQPMAFAEPVENHGLANILESITSRIEQASEMMQEG